MDHNPFLGCGLKHPVACHERRTQLTMPLNPDQEAHNSTCIYVSTHAMHPANHCAEQPPKPSAKKNRKASFRENSPASVPTPERNDAAPLCRTAHPGTRGISALALHPGLASVLPPGSASIANTLQRTTHNAWKQNINHCTCPPMSLHTSLLCLLYVPQQAIAE